MSTTPKLKYETYETKNKIIPQPTQILCIIPLKDWNYLKKKVSQVKRHFQLFDFLAPLFLGTGLTGIFTAILNHFTQVSTTIIMFTWVITVVAIVIGGFLIYLTRVQQKTEDALPESILEYMDFIEDRFIEQENSENFPETINHQQICE